MGMVRHAAIYKKVRLDTKGEIGALPMGSGGVLYPRLRGAQLGLVPPGSGNHGGGDEWVMCRYNDANRLRWRNIKFEPDGTIFHLSFEKRKNA